MSHTTTEEPITVNSQLENLIENAIKKVNGQKEKDICHYLPAENGGYLHHFTLKRMKGEDPTTLLKLVRDHILNTPNPKAIPPKPRATRGARKQRNKIVFSKDDLERLRQIASAAGDEEIIRKLKPLTGLKSIKKELIASIRHNQVNQQIFDLYKQEVRNQRIAEDRE